VFLTRRASVTHHHHPRSSSQNQMFISVHQTIPVSRSAKRFCFQYSVRESAPTTRSHTSFEKSDAAKLRRLFLRQEHRDARRTRFQIRAVSYLATGSPSDLPVAVVTRSLPEIVSSFCTGLSLAVMGWAPNQVAVIRVSCGRSFQCSRRCKGRSRCCPGRTTDKNTLGKSDARRATMTRVLSRPLCGKHDKWASA
jgi:hypothetical protein